MKFLSLFLLVVATFLSSHVAASTTTSSKLLYSTETVRKSPLRSLSRNNARKEQTATEYQPWPNGTPVAWEFPDDGWWTGTITNYFTHTGTYVIIWEDGSPDYYDDQDRVDQMVAYGAQQDEDGPSTTATVPTESPNDSTDKDTADETYKGLYPIGTPVGEQEDGIWYVGTITDFNPSTGQYTVRWAGTDGETERFFAGHTLATMVAEAETATQAIASGQNTQPPVVATAAPTKATTSATGAPIAMWEPGTPVAVFEDGQWWYGHIGGFNGKAYLIRWDDKEIEQISNMDFVNQMVSDAETQAVARATPAPTELKDKGGKYPIGTAVSTIDQDDGSLWTGTIESYYRGEYAVRWMDGSTDIYFEGPRMDDMVASAATVSTLSNNSGGSSMGRAGKVFLAFFLLLVIFGGTYIGLACYKKKQVRDNVQKNAALEDVREDDIVNYRDEPDDDLP